MPTMPASIQNIAKKVATQRIQDAAPEMLDALKYVFIYNLKDIEEHGPTATNHLIDVRVRAALDLAKR